MPQRYFHDAVVFVGLLLFSVGLADDSLWPILNQVNSYLRNGGHELIQRHLGLPDHVFYHPLAHFTRDEASVPQNDTLKRLDSVESVSDTTLLRSMGVYFPGVDDSSIIANGEFSRRMTILKQPKRRVSYVRGRRSRFRIWYHKETPVGVRNAFEYSLRIWANIFPCKPTLRIRVNWQALPGRTLASTVSGFNVIGGHPSTPKLQRHTAYTPVLAAALTGRDHLPSDKSHMIIYFNSLEYWHLDIGSSAPAGFYDLPTIALHEQCHALFFAGSAIGNGTAETAHFQSAREYPGRFDYFLQTPKGVGVARSCRRGELFRALTTPGLSFQTSIKGSTFGLHSPAKYALGSSTYHLDEARLAKDCKRYNISGSNCSDVMTPSLLPKYTRRIIGEPVLRIMRTILGRDAGIRRKRCTRL